MTAGAATATGAATGILAPNGMAAGTEANGTAAGTGAGATGIAAGIGAGATGIAAGTGAGTTGMAAGTPAIAATRGALTRGADCVNNPIPLFTSGCFPSLPGTVAGIAGAATIGAGAATTGAPA